MGYPTSAASFTTKVNGPGNTIDASHINDLQTEIAALEAALLTSGLAHHLKFVDATYDIGQGGATRPRDLFLSRNAVIGGTLAVTGVATFSALPLINAGLQFPATQAASAGVNVLDDYEEGTWTPVIGGSGGTSGQTYGAQDGNYVKVGKLVFASFNVQLTAEGTITTNAQIQGLPFQVSLAGNGAAIPIQWQNLATNWVMVCLVLGNSTTAVDIQGTAAAAASAVTALTAADIGNTTIFRGTIVYMASA